MSKQMFSVVHTYEISDKEGTTREKTKFIILANDAKGAEVLARLNEYPYCRDFGVYEIEEIPRGVVRLKN